MAAINPDAAVDALTAAILEALEYHSLPADADVESMVLRLRDADCETACFESQSSFIAGGGYDAHRRVLEVRFRRGDCRRYLDVPPGEWVAFRAAPSHGKFYGLRIKQRFISAPIAERVGDDANEEKSA